MTTTSSITKEQKRTKVTCTSVKKGQYQDDNQLTAELRQKVKTISIYPGIQTENDMQQNVFSASEFNATPKEYVNEEMRVAWIDVPAGVSVDDVQAKIPADASLYRVLSNAPILTSGHRNAIDRGLVTLDKIADAQVLRYPEGHEKAGKIILDQTGRVQYRKIFFWASKKEDIDLRGTVDEYKSAAIKAEVGDKSNLAFETPKPAIVLTNDEWQ